MNWTQNQILTIDSLNEILAIDHYGSNKVLLRLGMLFYNRLTAGKNDCMQII